MKRIPFNKRFINEAGDNLIDGKIHTIRQNYEYWKKFEGKEVAFFYWESKPYHSKQKVFCVKKLVSIQRILKVTDGITPNSPFSIYYYPNEEYQRQLLISELAVNDGLSEKEFIEWFANYQDGKMAILHFTDLRY